MSNPLLPKFTKGALIEFSNRIAKGVPNIILFQFNPENLSRSLESWYSSQSESNGNEGNSTAQPHDPAETFDLTIDLDALDETDNPISNLGRKVIGVAERLAALELLLYPIPEESFIEGLLGSATDSMAGKNKESNSDKIPRGTVPELLFIWGPGRTVPVRITSFSIEEQKFSPLLYPIRAKVTLGLKILTPKNIPCKENTKGKLAAAYDFYIKQKEAMATANALNILPL